MIDAVGALRALVQMIHGERTEAQQIEFEKTIANDMDVITIGIKDCRKVSRDEH